MPKNYDDEFLNSNEANAFLDDSIVSDNDQFPIQDGFDSLNQMNTDNVVYPDYMNDYSVNEPIPPSYFEPETVNDEPNYQYQDEEGNPYFFNKETGEFIKIIKADSQPVPNSHIVLTKEDLNGNAGQFQTNAFDTSYLNNGVDAINENISQTAFNTSVQEPFSNQPKNSPIKKKAVKWYQNKWVYAGAGIPFAFLLLVLIITKAFGGFMPGVGEDGSKLVLKQDEIRFELGEEVSISPEKVFDTSKISDKAMNSIDIQSDLKKESEKYDFDYSTGIVKNKKQDYLEAGEYTVVYKLNKDKKTLKVIVEDTEIPEFISPETEIIAEAGAQDFKIENYFIAKDKAKVKLSSDNNFELYSPGTYTVSVKAVDEAGNEAEIFTILELVSQESVKGGTQLSEMVNGYVPLSSDTLAKAKSGDIFVQTKTVSKEISQAASKSKSNDKSFKYSETPSAKDGLYKKSKFINSEKGNMNELGLSYKEFREFVNSGKSLEDFKKDKDEEDDDEDDFKLPSQNNKNDEEEEDDYWSWLNKQIADTRNNQSSKDESACTSLPENAYRTNQEAKKAADAYMHSEEAHKAGYNYYNLVWKADSCGERYVQVIYSHK